MPRLRRADPSTPGYTRRRRGRGFSYHDEDGEHITDEETLARIDDLVIPPAWDDVWICPHPNGHIQAMGTDAKGRRQYRYHDAWRAKRDREKFDHMVEFGRALPKIRHFVDEHLQLDGMPRERVLAAAVRLLDAGFFRIGTEGYTEENGSVGLSTIRKEHVCIKDDAIVFDYPGKSGKRRLQSVVDADARAVVERLLRRRGGGEELLAYKSGNRWVDVKSGEINAYIKDISGGDFSAKDFRTWSATVLACIALAVSSETAKTATRRKRAVTRMYKEVSRYLGNTPAVCRSSYVDPRVVDRFRGGETVLEALVAADDADDADISAGCLSFHGTVEVAVIELLDAA